METPSTPSSQVIFLVISVDVFCHVVQYSKEFGYSRKDVILIGVGILAFGYALYYGLQAGGVSPGLAGNYVQLFVVLGLCIGWIGSYIGRVANKVGTACCLHATA